MKILLLLFSFLISFTSCTYYIKPPSAKYKEEIGYTYKNTQSNTPSKWRKYKQKIRYQRFDLKGNIIEEGEYGEVSHSRNVSDTAVTSGHVYNNKNLNTVHYFHFDNLGKKVTDELWRFRNNRKEYLIYRTVFEYDSTGRLVKELEYDSDGNLSRLQDYSANTSNQSVSKDSVFNFSFQGIVRVDGQRQDTIITDSLNRPIEKVHYYKGKFLYREIFRYDHYEYLITELRYDDKPDSLWCITEWEYNTFNQPVRKLWKVIGDMTEEKDIYVYNRKRQLVKILHYSREELRGYEKYKYKLW